MRRSLTSILNFVELVRVKFKLPEVRIVASKYKAKDGGRYKRYPKPVIYYNADDYGPIIVLGLLLHELGHHWVAHKVKRKMSLEWEEYTAERFAVLAMVKLLPKTGKRYLEISRGQLQFLKKISPLHYMAFSAVYLAYADGVLE